MIVSYIAHYIGSSEFQNKERVSEDIFFFPSKEHPKSCNLEKVKDIQHHQHDLRIKVNVSPHLNNRQAVWCM